MRALGILAIGMALAVTSCAKKPAAADPQPSQVMKETFINCTWGKVENKTMSIWSYACPVGAGQAKLVGDDSVGGFAMVSDAPDAAYRNVVIRTFSKAKDAPLESVLPQVLAITGEHGASCQLVAAEAVDWLPGKIYRLEPTGAEKAAYDTANEIEPQMNPCGELGIGPAGDRFFKVLEGDATKVVYLDMGSEIQMFDATTLKAK